MKKFLFSLLLSVAMLCSFGQTGTFNYYRITNAGGTVSVGVSVFPNTIYVYCSSGVVLANNYALNLSALPPVGTRAKLILDLTNLDFNGFTVTVFGWSVSEEQATKLQYYEYTVIKDHTGSSAGVYNFAPLLLDYDNTQQLYGNTIINGTLPLAALEDPIPLSSMDTVTRGRVLVGNSSNALSSLYAAGSAKVLIGDGSDLTSKTVTGDVTISSSAVTTIDSVIVDADIKTGAAIKRQKLATGTASYVCVNTSAGYLTDEQYLLPVRGGTGISTSASTGFPSVSSGTWSVNAITDVRGLDNLSFVTANQGIYYLYFPFAATATNINCRVTSVIAGTDAGSLTLANNSGTVMAGSSLTAGVLTIATSAAFGTGYSSTLTSNNTFTAGQSMQLTTAKTTTGGVLHCDVTYTRTQ